MTAKLRANKMNAEVTMLPVAAGDATLIVWSDGWTTRAILIDAGLREHDALSYLQSVGIFHLDLIILSHPDLDHLGGLLAIMKSRAMSVDLTALVKLYSVPLNDLKVLGVVLPGSRVRPCNDDQT